MSRILKRITAAVVTSAALAACVLAWPGSCTAADETITSREQLNRPGMKIGVGTGSASAEIAENEFTNAEIVYFTDNVSAYEAVAQGKADAYVFERSQMQLALDSGLRGVHLLDENMDEDIRVAVGISPVSRIPDLKGKLNSFIAELKADGTLDEMYDRWVFQRSETMPEISPAENPEYSLTVATSGVVPPFSYYTGQNLNGFDIEMANRFASWLGAEVTFRVYDYDAIIPAAVTGDVDCIMANLNITPEREEALPFSDVLYTAEIGILVRGDPASAAGYTSLKELDGKQIGVQTGTSFDIAVSEQMPNARILYFNTKADMINALQTGKIDAFAVDEPVAQMQMTLNDRLTYLAEFLEQYDFAYVFPKNDRGGKLCEQFSEYLRSIRDDGTMEAIKTKWFSDDDSLKTIDDYRSFPAPNGVLRMATEAQYEPFSYILNNQIAGYDIDIAVHFCEAYGYGLEINDMSFDAVLPSVQTGKSDFGGSGITITEERKESVLFSEPNFSGGTVMTVLKAEQAGTEGSSFWSEISESFRKTFIREDRWKLFADGVLTTLVITVLSVLCGTALGFGVFMLCRNGNAIANGVTRFCIWLVQGMPAVVLLMVLYYIVFGSVSVSGLIVAVIGFTLTFGSSVFGLLKMGVGTVDRGQYEAAYALGHTNRHTFFRIILPQALPHIMPAYKGEIVGLIKATAIVGYIAVQDLTKMGDIVRSRTYEAFFPLIAITIIYFALESLLGFLIGRIRIRIDPKRRTPGRILKGVKTGD